LRPSRSLPSSQNPSCDGLLGAGLAARARSSDLLGHLGNGLRHFRLSWMVVPWCTRVSRPERSVGTCRVLSPAILSRETLAGVASSCDIAQSVFRLTSLKGLLRERILRLSRALLASGRGGIFRSLISKGSERDSGESLANPTCVGLGEVLDGLPSRTLNRSLGGLRGSVFRWSCPRLSLGSPLLSSGLGRALRSFRVQRFLHGSVLRPSRRRPSGRLADFLEGEPA